MNTLESIEKLMRRKNYAESTIESYISMLRNYSAYCRVNKKNPKTDVIDYLDFMAEKHYSSSYKNMAVNAIKFYYEHILGYEKTQFSIDRPKKEKKLPCVLSKGEIKKILDSTENLKHRIILKIIYGCGLRISELIGLRLTDIDSTRKCLHIKQAKGKKDRIVPISTKLLEEMRSYYLEYLPKNYLIEGSAFSKGKYISNGEKYSARSIQQILKRALKKARIYKPATVHTLRHSYATHLLEMGVSLRSIQVLLGHNSSKTTEIYTHISNIHIEQTPCPLDFL